MKLNRKVSEGFFFWTAGKDFGSLHTPPLPNQSFPTSSTPIPSSTYAFLSFQIEECGVKSSQEPQFPSSCSMKSWINSGSLIICESRGTDLMITKPLPTLNSPFLLHCSFLYKWQSHRDQSWVSGFSTTPRAVPAQGYLAHVCSLSSRCPAVHTLVE